jgi:glycosyltransferase involved in cell wall biosynthesis
MRVLHVVPSLDPATGGPARAVPALCEALAAEGLDVALWAFRRPGAAVTTEAVDAPYPVRYFEPVPGTHELPTLGYRHDLLAALPSYDLVHLHSLWNGVATLTARTCRRRRTPYILTPHGMLQSTSVRRKRVLKAIYYRLLERFTVSGATALHFLGEAEATESARYVRPGTRRFVITNGVGVVNTEEVTRGAFRSKHPALEGRRIVLSVGRVHWSKGLWLQAEALPALLRRVPEAIWVVIGPDGGERSRLEAWLAVRGLQDHVYWTGERPHFEVLEALTDAEVFVLTSLHEANSMALNEALAVGTPVVVCASAASADLERAGAAAMVARDAGTLADAVADALERPERALSLRVNARAYALDVLAWPLIAREMCRAYAAVLATAETTLASGSHAVSRRG